MLCFNPFIADIPVLNFNQRISVFYFTLHIAEKGRDGNVDEENIP
jgi:hypothetical protein